MYGHFDLQQLIVYSILLYKFINITMVKEVTHYRDIYNTPPVLPESSL